MKFAPKFPSIKSIAQTIAFIVAVVGGIETRRNPWLGVGLVLVAIIVFWATKFLKPKNA